MALQYTDHMTGDEYNELRLSVGFHSITEGQAQRGLEHTTFLTAVRDGGKIVAMGRMLFDFGYTAYLGDVIVRPEYQGQGIGKRIVENLIDRTMDSAHEGEWIMFILGAAKNKEPFYEKLGFQKRPNETSGGGMSMYRTKQKRR
ncbi:N-acetyltransferase [bacterium D16-50]|jgi:predicted N-acetyltransferase YhbS|nr:GNAT family N-acetyltransferase [Lachnospiraceae bacterium]RKJ19363.1 N-acetyltransferase [bacterium D16-50]